MTIDDLIQLMRLSGTDKVRAFLYEQERLALRGNARARGFIDQLEIMFTECKRNSISEAWPSPHEISSRS